MKEKFVLLSAFLILFSAALIAPQAEAQTKKKKKTSRNTSAAVTPTPIPQTIPQVISRADEFPVQDQIIITQDQPVQTEETENTETQTTSTNAADLEARIKALESTRQNAYDEKQKRLLMNLDILTRAEQRSEGLRKQVFEIIEKQNNLQTRIDQITQDMQPAMIDRYASMAGSLRPEQVREARLKSLESERRNLETLLTTVSTTRSSLEANLLRADDLVEKLRVKLEKDIDEALIDKEDQ